MYQVNSDARYASNFVFPFLALLSAIGNVSTFIFTVKQTAFKGSINLLIINIAVGNLIIMVVSCINMADETYGIVGCQTLQGITFCCFGAVLLSHAGVSIERYIGVCRPFQARFKRTRIGLYVLLLSWWTSIPLSVVYAVVKPAYYHVSGEGYFCGETYGAMFENEAHYTGVVIYTDVLYGLFLGIPNCIMICLYIKIIYTLKHQKKERKKMSHTTTQNDRGLKQMDRTIHMLITSVILFDICWLPTYLTLLFYVINSVRAESIIEVVALFLAFSYGALQPFVYPVFNERYKKAYKDALRKVMCFCKKKKNKDHHAEGKPDCETDTLSVSGSTSINCLSIFETKL